MKVAVYGLWHLGSVTAACLASYGVEIIGLDRDATNVAKLKNGEPPLYEPGLADLIAAGRRAGTLDFTDRLEAAREADVVWVTFDTPLDEDDVADVGYVQDRIVELFPHLGADSVVLISSQMPVGSVAALERLFAPQANGRRVSFAYSPENLRLGQAIDAFKAADRIIVGVRDAATRARLAPLFEPICANIDWMGVESAEMVKHALNSFLATCITYTNEIATVCESVGADPREVERALRSDRRIGKYAYVRAGAAFGGGTLARDVRFLEQIGRDRKLTLPVLGSILESNEAHRYWPLHRLRSILGTLRDRRIAVLGVAYKQDTDSIRRSTAIEICRLLVQDQASVVAYDPKVRALPADLAPSISLTDSMHMAIEKADAAIVATEWPELQVLNSSDVISLMKRPLLVDQSNFLASRLEGRQGVEYVTFRQNS